MEKKAWPRSDLQNQNLHLIKVPKETYRQVKLKSTAESNRPSHGLSLVLLADPRTALGRASRWGERAENGVQLKVQQK